ncbi:TPA: EAL domain-containing protein [Candidatus Sumerlaeota bacterium]|nr:EAL domain-containing protein [Candidatus Sumerlaeota bacterium]
MSDTVIDRSLLLDVLQNESLFIHFQPICSVFKKSVIGVEALSRGIHPTTGVTIPPAALFQAAREEGLALELDRLCRRKAFDAFSLLVAEYPGLTLFVNIDSTILTEQVVGSGNIVDNVKRLGLHPGNIVIELIEEGGEQIHAMHRFVENYRDAGFVIALDDMGSGHSNLERVCILKPDVLKIDRSLVNGIDQEFHKQETFRAMSALAHKIGAMVIAEGVETYAQILTVLDLGADLLQGYYLGKPDLIHAEHFKEINQTTEGISSAMKKLATRKIQESVHEQTTHMNIASGIGCEIAKANPDSYNRLLGGMAKCYGEIECTYILNGDGIQISETIFSTTPPATRQKFIFQPAKSGADHSLKEFFLQLNAGRSYFLSAPYISLASGRFCRTVSMRFHGKDSRERVLCIDFTIRNNHAAASEPRCV